MPTSFFVALAVLVATVIVAREMGERAQNLLSDQQKLELGGQFEAFRKYQLVPLLALLLVWLFLMHSTALDRRILQWLVLAVLVAYVLGLNGYLFVRLRHLSLPPDFLRLYMFGRAIQVAGLAAFVALVLGAG